MGMESIICITVMQGADSQICGTRIKIQVQRLPSNGNGAEVLGIVLLGRSSHSAISGSGRNIRRGSDSVLLVCLPHLDWAWGKGLCNILVNSKCLFCAPNGGGSCKGHNGQGRKRGNE